MLTLDGKFNPNPGDSFGVCTVPCRTGAIRWCPKDPFKIGVCEAKLGEKCVVATDCKGWGSGGNYVSCCGGRCTDRSEVIESEPN